MNDEVKGVRSVDGLSHQYGKSFLLTLGIIALAAMLYGRTLNYGWHWDDYHQVRPYTGREVAAAFHGPWDPGGSEAAFYRPLTVAWFALRFQLFGYSAPSYHAASLVLLVACAAGTGLLVARLTESRLAGAASAALLLLHPVTSDSLAVWSANQPHLLALLVALAAANWVLKRQPATLLQWLPGLLAVAVSFALKEDGLALMLWLPAVLAAKQRRWPSLRFILVFVGLAAFFVAARGVLLGQLGGYTEKRLGLELLIAHALRGPATVLALGVGHGRQLLQLGFAPGERSGLQAVAALSEYALHYIAIASLAVGGLWARRSPAFIAGVSGLALFNAPMIWQSKASGWHHLVLAATLVLAAAGHAIANRLEAHGAPWLPTLCTLACLALLVPVNVLATNIYRPCSAFVRSADEGSDLSAWIAQGRVPEAMRLELEQKRAACAGR